MTMKFNTSKVLKMLGKICARRHLSWAAHFLHAFSSGRPCVSVRYMVAGRFFDATFIDWDARAARTHRRGAWLWG